VDGFQSFPAPAKLNLYLRVLGRRADGYHLLDTQFVLLDAYDIVRLRVRADGKIERARETADQAAALGIAAEDDLTLRAARLLQARTGCKLGVQIALEKNLPIGAGLGGGSSDAAATLVALNKLWDTHLTRAQLMRLALELGADVPFFVFGENAHGSGVGEVLRARAVPPAHYIVLNPQVVVSTREVFAQFDLTHPASTGTIQPLAQAQTRNDLESAVCERYPEVRRHLSWLRRFGDGRLTGSGASVFLACEDAAGAHKIFAQRPSDMRGFIARGLEKHPLIALC
jgi:4-diphosphocytidyl-2-C-methyl-D-erythritol kinase